MQSFEFAVLDFIQNNIANDFLDFIMPKITALGNAGVLWIVLTVIFLISKKYRSTGCVMLIALVLDLILCNIILKPLVARTRPYDINTAFELLIPAQHDYSFSVGTFGCVVCGCFGYVFYKMQPMETCCICRRGNSIFEIISVCTLSYRCGGRNTARNIKRIGGSENI